MEVQDDERVKNVAFQRPSVRRSILFSYWAVVLLAIPLWWTTTSISRLPLPASRVQAQKAKELVFPLNIALDGTNDTDLAASVENRLKQLLGSSRHHFHLGVQAGASAADYVVELEDKGQERRIRDRKLAYGLGSVPRSEAHQGLASLLSSLLWSKDGSGTFDHRVVEYSPRYRLAFSLLNEDAAAAGAAHTWEVDRAFEQVLLPITNKMSVLHNFTVESQVQFHAPLAFTPNVFTAENGSNIHFLDQDQLSVFVNSAEWTLSSSVTNDPVIHFVLFVPSSTRRPLRILDSKARLAESNAFIIPQWGGIVILNPESEHDRFALSSSDLAPVFLTFRKQLLSLLGVAPLPAGVVAEEQLTDWQLDTLLRKRALENVRGGRETLESIIQVVDQIEGMPVERGVQSDIERALDALDKAFTVASTSPKLALQYSSSALTLASKAFFNPDMLAMLYFPAEHKLAVYLPLFSPVTLPLIAAAVREFKDWRRSRRQQGPAAAAPGRADQGAVPSRR